MSKMNIEKFMEYKDQFVELPQELKGRVVSLYKLMRSMNCKDRVSRHVEITVVVDGKGVMTTD